MNKFDFSMRRRGMAQNHWFTLMASQYSYIAVEVTGKLALSSLIDSWVKTKN